MDEVRELDRVLDEEHRDVVADQVPVAFPGVELGREPADVPGEVGGPLVAGHRGEPDEDGRAQARLAEGVGPGDVGQRLVVLEVAVRPEAAGVDHPLGYPLVVEVEDLLAEVEVLDKAGAALAGPQRVLVVADRHALLGRQPPPAVRRGLVRLAAAAPDDLLVAVPYPAARAVCLRCHHASRCSAQAVAPLRPLSRSGGSWFRAATPGHGGKHMTAARRGGSTAPRPGWGGYRGAAVCGYPPATSANGSASRRGRDRCPQQRGYPVARRTPAQRHLCGLRGGVLGRRRVQVDGHVAVARVILMQAADEAGSAPWPLPEIQNETSGDSAGGE